MVGPARPRTGSGMALVVTKPSSVDTEKQVRNRPKRLFFVDNSHHLTFKSIGIPPWPQSTKSFSSATWDETPKYATAPTARQFAISPSPPPRSGQTRHRVRSEESRVGKEGARTCRPRGSPYN